MSVRKFCRSLKKGQVLQQHPELFNPSSEHEASFFPVWNQTVQSEWTLTMWLSGLWSLPVHDGNFQLPLLLKNVNISVSLNLVELSEAVWPLSDPSQPSKSLSLSINEAGKPRGDGFQWWVRSVVQARVNKKKTGGRGGEEQTSSSFLCLENRRAIELTKTPRRKQRFS